MENSFDINFSDVKDLDPERCGVIYRTGTPPFYHNMRILDKKEFLKFKFELTKFIKKHPDPEERYYPYEVQEGGCYSIIKEERLIESRKTREEKNKDMDYQNWLRAECKRIGIKNEKKRTFNNRADYDF